MCEDNEWDAQKKKKKKVIAYNTRYLVRTYLQEIYIDFSVDFFILQFVRIVLSCIYSVKTCPKLTIINTRYHQVYTGKQKNKKKYEPSCGGGRRRCRDDTFHLIRRTSRLFESAAGLSLYLIFK